MPCHKTAVPLWTQCGEALTDLLSPVTVSLRHNHNSALGLYANIVAPNTDLGVALLMAKRATIVAP